MDNKMNKQQNDRLTIDNRVLILELFKERTELEIKEIKQENKEINKTLRDIKYLIIGGLGFYIIQNIGILEFAKKIIL